MSSGRQIKIRVPESDGNLIIVAYTKARAQQHIHMYSSTQCKFVLHMRGCFQKLLNVKTDIVSPY